MRHKRLFYQNVCEQNSNISMLDEYKQEYTAFGQTVYRGSALKAEFSDGCRDILLQYNGYDIDKNTLKLRFSDKVYPFIITLNYAVSDDNDIITRWTAVENHSDTSVFFLKSFSALNSICRQRSPIPSEIQTAPGEVKILKQKHA